MIINGTGWPLAQLTIRSDALYAECPNCAGTGKVWNLPFNPSEKEGWAECVRCGGDGELELNPTAEEFEEIAGLLGK